MKYSAGRLLGLLHEGRHHDFYSRVSRWCRETEEQAKRLGWDPFDWHEEVEVTVWSSRINDDEFDLMFVLPHEEEGEPSE